MHSNLKYIALILLSLLMSRVAQCQTFRCDGSLLFSVNNEISSNTINKVTFIPWGGIALGPLYFNPEGNFDALGFNPVDNFIYAALEKSNKIVRLKSDKTYDVIGEVNGSDTLQLLAGDCTPDGKYLLLENRSDIIRVFDVVDDFQLIDEIKLYWSADSGNEGIFRTRLDDIAVDPTNPSVAYAYQGNYESEETEPVATRGFLLQILIDKNHPEVGKVTPISALSEPSVQKMGSLIFSNAGLLFGYGSAGDDAEYLQNNLVTIDKWSGMASIARERGPTAMSSDGCSCPYQLSFYNDARPRELPCSDTVLTYHLQIFNRFFIPLEGVTLTDTVSEGLVIEAITGDYLGNISAGTGIGTNEIEITDLLIPARSVVTVNIETRVVDIPAKVTKNRATLSNLPERYGGVLLSDDPLSPGTAIDDTDHLIYANRMDDYEIDIVPPVDCLDSMGAEIKIKSEILVPGQMYEVKLLDQEYLVDTFQVTIDDKYSFVLDSMAPGEYKLFELTPQTTNCPFAIKDSVIEIEAPHDLLKTTAISNSPVCEENDIQLKGTATPGGEVVWKGPARFATEEFEALIPKVTTDYSGNYIMRTTYGNCKQADTIEVIVAPLIELKMQGDSSYCERGTVELLAEGIGEDIDYRWISPDNNSQSINPFRKPDVDLSDKGPYKVIADNGACRDTVEMDVEILEAPTISIEPIIITDHCEPLVFSPEVEGGTSISYQWSSPDFLDCIDCPEPQALVPLQPQYKLRVQNENACLDSTVINVTLSRENLIYLPNVFMPGLSTVDNSFSIHPGCQIHRINHVTIYDSWGMQVFHQGPINSLEEPISWDGYLRSQLVNAGVYNYDLELELVNGDLEKIHGTVTLLR